MKELEKTAVGKARIARMTQRAEKYLEKRVEQSDRCGAQGAVDVGGPHSDLATARVRAEIPSVPPPLRPYDVAEQVASGEVPTERREDGGAAMTRRGATVIPDNPADAQPSPGVTAEAPLEETPDATMREAQSGETDVPPHMDVDAVHEDGHQEGSPPESQSGIDMRDILRLYEVCE